MVSSTWRIGHTICAFLTTSQSHTTCSLKSKPTLLRLLVSLQRHPTGLIRRHDNGERITVLEVQIDQLLRALVCLAIARLSYPTAESTPPDSSPRRQTAGCRRRRHLSHRSPPIPLVSSRGCINDSKKYTRRSSATSSYASSPSETPTACRETTRLALSATASFDGTLDETSPPPPLFELQETGELAGLRHQLVTRLQLTQLRPHLL